MTTIGLRCVDKDHKDQMWSLELDDDRAVFTDSAGVVAALVYPEEAASVFQMPSFSDSIKYFGLMTETRLWQFDVDKAGPKQIREFINRTIAAAGPEAVAAVRKKAVRDLAIGGAGVLGGVAASVLTYAKAASNPQGVSYFVFHGVVIFGLIMLGKAVVGFRQHARLRSMTQL